MKTKQNIIFNLLSELRNAGQPFRIGRWTQLCQTLQDELGKRQFRMRTRENLSLANLPLGYRESPEQRDCSPSCQKPGRSRATAGYGWGWKAWPLKRALLPSQSYCLPVNVLSLAANCIYGFLEFSEWSNFLPQTIFIHNWNQIPTVYGDKTAWHHPLGSCHFRHGRSLLFKIKWMWSTLWRLHPAPAKGMVLWAQLEELGKPQICQVDCRTGLDRRGLAVRSLCFFSMEIQLH